LKYSERTNNSKISKTCLISWWGEIPTLFLFYFFSFFFPTKKLIIIFLNDKSIYYHGHLTRKKKSIRKPRSCIKTSWTKAEAIIIPLKAFWDFFLALPILLLPFKNATERFSGGENINKTIEIFKNITNSSSSLNLTR